jgi:hypothetical protein
MAKAKRQIDKFRKAARELGTDNSEKRFDERLGKIAKQKPGALPSVKRRAKKAPK